MPRQTADVVINCVGLVKQLPNAENPIDAITINSFFPHKMAEICTKIGARFIHISTDCVFSGAKGNYHEDDGCDAKDFYGRSKLLGEVAMVMPSHCALNHWSRIRWPPKLA